MLKNLKKGFGWVIGSSLAYATIHMIHDSIMKWGAKDKAFMEREKTHNPDLYEKLKKYQPKNEEES